MYATAITIRNIVLSPNERLLAAAQAKIINYEYD